MLKFITTNMTQLNLLSDKVCCHCGVNPGTKPTNSILWNGFFDQDTQQYVGSCCEVQHYEKKNKTKLRHLYSEFPVYAITK